MDRQSSGQLGMGGGVQARAPQDETQDCGVAMLVFCTLH